MTEPVPESAVSRDVVQVVMRDVTSEDLMSPTCIFGQFSLVEHSIPSVFSMTPYLLSPCG